MRYLSILGLLVVFTSVPSVNAQGLVSAGIGVGAAIGDRHSDSGENGHHAAAYVQLHVPVFPFAFRLDGILTRDAAHNTRTSLLADAVYVLPVPVVHPYALAGYGKYGVGKESDANGWNAGIGVRVRTPVVAIYAEARRHQRIPRDLLTIGISR